MLVMVAGSNGGSITMSLFGCGKASGASIFTGTMVMGSTPTLGSLCDRLAAK